MHASNSLKLNYLAQQRASTRRERTLDTVYLHHFLANVMDIGAIGSSPSPYTPLLAPQSPTPTATTPLIGHFIELLMHVHLANDDHELMESMAATSALITLLGAFDRRVRRRDVRSLEAAAAVVECDQVHRLVSTWLTRPSFLTSSHQFAKNQLVKHLLVELVRHELYDAQEANLLGHLLRHAVQAQDVSAAVSAYQLELIYDLARSLLECGACNSPPTSTLAQLCLPFSSPQQASPSCIASAAASAAAASSEANSITGVS